MAVVKVKPIETLHIFDFKSETDKTKIPAGCIAVLDGYATLSGNKDNKNKHFYPGRTKPGTADSFWDSVLIGDKSIEEKLATKTFFGSFKHPDKDESPIPEFGSISHNVRSFRIDDKGVFVTLDVFDTAQGRELKPLLDYGSKLGISTRAYGEVEMDKEGFKVPIKDKYHFVTWDLVSLPAFSETRMNKISDEFEIDIDNNMLKAETKDEFLEHAKKLQKSDAKVLCDYMGIDFKEISDSFHKKCETGCTNCGKCKGEKTEPEVALDQALDTIVKLEKELEDVKKERIDLLCPLCKTKLIKNAITGDYTCPNDKCKACKDGVESKFGTGDKVKVNQKGHSLDGKIVYIVGVQREGPKGWIYNVGKTQGSKEYEAIGEKALSFVDSIDKEEFLRLHNSVQYHKSIVHELIEDNNKLKQDKMYLQDSFNQLKEELSESKNIIDSLESDKQTLQRINKHFENKTTALEGSSSKIQDSITSIPATARKNKTRPLFLATGKVKSISDKSDEEGLREVLDSL